MPTVSLILTTPQVTYSDDELESNSWRLTYECALANSYRQHVDLTTEEESLSNLKGTVAFESSRKEAYNGFEKGSLTYWKGSDDIIHPNPPSYLITLRMADDHLGRLMQTIGDGIALMSVNVSVEGLEYGWEPDGSGKKWDNASNPKMEINGYRLFFGRHEEEEIVPNVPEPVDDTSAKVLTAVRDSRQTMRYILYVLIALTVAVIVRR